MQPEENRWLSIPQTRAIQRPTIDPQFEDLNPVVRSTECLRYFVLSTEHWLSPNGRLRWWLKINLLLSIGLFIPVVLLMPVISLVLHEADRWLSMLLSIAWKIIVLSTVVSVVVCVIKHRHKRFPSSSKGSSRRRK